MAYIKENWNNKDLRANDAVNHTKKMAQKYNKEIRNSIIKTVIYDEYFTLGTQTTGTKISIVKVSPIDSVSAIFKYHEGKTAVLNFSSYKHPGGMFLAGSRSQEECLCHESFLYNVLSANIKFYENNKKDLNKALYLNRALYTPEIIFEKNNSTVKVDVITCAAPNKSTAQRYCNVSDEENSSVLKSRIEYIFNIAEDNNVNTLILGAYGCGVFGQDSTEVAKIFSEIIKNGEFIAIKKVIFAIPEGRNNNLLNFKKVFS